MSQPQVTMDVRILDDWISVIAIQGDLSSSAEHPLMDAYLRACALFTDDGSRRSPTTIIIDCTQIGYVNSGGIGLLITLLIRMHRQKQRMLVCGLSEHYQRIFQVTRLDAAIGIFDTEREALAAVHESRDHVSGSDGLMEMKSPIGKERIFGGEA
jgi:anti-sigma B factor antagonist